MFIYLYKFKNGKSWSAIIGVNVTQNRVYLSVVARIPQTQHKRAQYRYNSVTFYKRFFIRIFKRSTIRKIQKYQKETDSMDYKTADHNRITAILSGF